MAGTRIVSVIGRKNAGKTTLVVALAQEFVRKRRKVATLKHGHHPAILDTDGKDTWRHYHEGKAQKVMIESPGARVLFERTEAEQDPLTLARKYLNDVDIVIVEGFKRFPLPKIEVHRKSEHPAPIYDLSQTDPGDWIAMVTDDRKLRLPFPCFNFSDTSWFVSLAHMAWEKARPLDQD